MTRPTPSFEPYQSIEVVSDPYNLDGLRYEEPFYDVDRQKKILLTPKRVQDFVEELNTSNEDSRPLVIILGCGGTPTMSPQGKGKSLTPSFDTQQLLTHTDLEMQEDFHIVTFDAFETDSSQMDIDDVGDLTIATHYIWQEMSYRLKSRFMGFGIINGSDTMDESGGHFSMMQGVHQPFNTVHGGTEKSLAQDRVELWRMLHHMVYALFALYENQRADNLTIFGEKILLTAGLHYGPDGMDTPLHRPVLDDINRLLDPRAPDLPDWLRRDYGEWTQGDPLVIYRGDNKIGVLEARMAENRRQVESMVRDVGFGAIILTTHHSGTYDARVMQQLSNLIEREHHEIPLFAINPVPTDKAPRLDTYAASAEWMLNMNVQPLDMTVEAAQAKLMRLLSERGREDPRHPAYIPIEKYQPGNDLPRTEQWSQRLVRIRKAMTTNYLGEIPNEQNRRVRRGK